MRDLRSESPAAIAGVEVLRRKDYTDGSVVDCRTGEKSAMELSGSNVLRYELADGTTILVRPSGTEPKIRVMVEGEDMEAIQSSAERIADMIRQRIPGVC